MDFSEKLKIVQIMMGKQWGEITIHQRALILQRLATYFCIPMTNFVEEFVKTMDEEIDKILKDSTKIVILSEGKKTIVRWNGLT